MDRLAAMRAFSRVAELQSFSRAAKALGLSRARVSEAVAELEQTLGVTLLHRSTRHVCLTDDGRLYHERVKQILLDVADAEALVLGSKGPVRGHFRVAMPMAIARTYVVPRLAPFLQRFPDLQLELRFENRALHLLGEGVDCALSYGAPADDSLVALNVLSTRLVTCAAPAYLRGRGLPQQPEQLELHACVSFLSLDSARPSPWIFLQDGVRSTWQPKGQVAFNSMEACVDAAAAGLGVTQVLSALAAPALAQRKLLALLEAHAAPGPTIYLVYPPHRRASPGLRVLLEFLRGAFSLNSEK